MGIFLDAAQALAAQGSGALQSADSRELAERMVQANRRRLQELGQPDLQSSVSPRRAVDGLQSGAGHSGSIINTSNFASRALSRSSRSRSKTAEGQVIAVQVLGLRH